MYEGQRRNGMKRMGIGIWLLLVLFGMTSCAGDVLKATNTGNTAAVENAIASGSDINKKDKNGNTPLILAARHGDAGIVRALLMKGADVAIKNNDGYDALLALTSYTMMSTPTDNKTTEPIGVITEGHLKAAALLLDHGADVNTKTKDGMTALLVATKLRKKDIVDLLLSKGAAVNATDQQGATALIIAASKGYGELICPLLRKGADKEIKDTKGNTAFSYADKNGYREITELLNKPCPSDSLDKSASPVLERPAEERLAEKLIESLRDPDASVRWDSARRLGELQDRRATIPLVEAMADAHPYVRRRAAVALGALHDIRAVDVLIKALDDEDSFVKKFALEALEKITGQQIGNDSNKWREWWKEKIRQN
jgi:ankyrin repeat protein